MNASRNFTANKKSNEYADTMPDMPKAVLMAIACSAFSSGAFMFPHGDDGTCCDVGEEPMLRRIAHAWSNLHSNGIVPQPVSKEWRQYL